jgi:hypothetical protein
MGDAKFLDREQLLDFVKDQVITLDTALQGIKEYGDKQNLKDWFEGRRDSCVIFLRAAGVM